MEPLIVGKVIEDVVDVFTPAVNLSVSYVPKEVANGREIKPSAATNRPKTNRSLHPRTLAIQFCSTMVW